VVTIDDTPRSRGLQGGAVCNEMVNGEEIATVWRFELGQRSRLHLQTVAEPYMGRQAFAVIDDLSGSVSTDRTEAP